MVGRRWERSAGAHHEALVEQVEQWRIYSESSGQPLGEFKPGATQSLHPGASHIRMVPA